MRICITLFLTALLLHTSVLAADIPQSLYDELETEELVQAVPRELQGLLEGFSFFGAENIGEISNRIKAYGLELLRDGLSNIRTPILQTLSIILICSLLSGVFQDERSEFPIRLFGGIAIVSFSISEAGSFSEQCLTALEQMYDFSTVLLPCLAGASLFAGATVSAGVKYTAAALFMNGLLNACVNVLAPLITVYLAAMIGGVLFEQRILTTVAKWLKWCCMSLLTGSVALFVAYINIAGLITSAGDVFATRLTKTALSTGLPVVGKIISDTASTLVAGAGVLRNCVGVYGVLAIVCIMLVPFISVGLRYVLFKLISELSDLFPNKCFSELTRGIAGAFGMMVGVLGAGFVFIFMTLISFMQVMAG